jgi:hypothetical protein
MWNIDIIQMQQCYETLVTLRRGQDRRSFPKTENFIWLIYSLYKNDYRNLKPQDSKMAARGRKQKVSLL